MTFREMKKEVDQLASAFIELGLEAKDHVALAGVWGQKGESGWKVETGHMLLASVWGRRGGSGREGSCEYISSVNS